MFKEVKSQNLLMRTISVSILFTAQTFENIIEVLNYFSSVAVLRIFFLLFSPLCIKNSHENILLRSF